MPLGTGDVSISTEPVRQRATKACARCNQRKIKCDAAALTPGTPCSRCRMDGVSVCLVGASRRGTYAREAPHRRRLGHTNSREIATGQASNSQARVMDSDSSRLHSESTVGAARPSPQSNSGDDEHGTRRSLASLFEDFLKQTGHSSDDAAAELGIMLFGESSPLTFALREYSQEHAQEQPTSMHDAEPDLFRSKLLLGHARDNYPAHCSPAGITYLESKGAFTAPTTELQDILLAAYIDRFHPLYAIVSRPELSQSQGACNLPWILLHAMCFIGATFCDTSAIHKSGFKSRLHVRRAFHDRVKVLFDTGYERDKFVLLQVTIMMTFWGPQMRGYWNPCSWVGFAVTIAESLGLHRSISSADASGKDKGLVKRLWWRLVVRDTYCATLLGRPFRIDLSQSDTDMLSLADFREDVQLDSDAQFYAQYQIQVAHLSLIARKIAEQRPVAGRHQCHATNLHELLDEWHARVPKIHSSVIGRMGRESFFASCSNMLYHYHKILIHLSGAGAVLPGQSQAPEIDRSHTSPDEAQASAQIISSMASMMVMRQMILQLPHEVFAGFFVAGIVLYRQVRQAGDAVSQMARALLDNCQMLLNEVREVWDPAFWVIRIFDFLLTTRSDTQLSENAQAPSSDDLRPASALYGIAATTAVNPFNIGIDALDDVGGFYPVDWASPNGDFLEMYKDVLLMPPGFIPNI